MKTWKIISLLTIVFLLVSLEAKAQFEDSMFLRYRYTYAGDYWKDIREYEFVDDDLTTIEFTPRIIIVYFPGEDSVGYPVINVTYDEERESLDVDALTVDRDKIYFSLHKDYALIMIDKRNILLFTNRRIEY